MSTRSSGISWPGTVDPAEQPTDDGARSSYRLVASKKLRAAWLYGDGTPSPHSEQLFVAARNAIDCGVTLLQAHAAIAQAAARRDRLLELARTATQAEWAAIDASTASELPRARALADAGRALAQRAIEALLLKHDVPGTRRALRMVARGDTYALRADITTPFGVDAELDLWIPEHHPWRTIRRFEDLLRPTRTVSADSGVHSTGALRVSEAMGGLFVTALDVDAHRIVLTLREEVDGGSGYTIAFDAEDAQIRIGMTRLAEDGTHGAGQPIRPDERAPLLRAWKRVLESTRDLGMYRRAVVGMSIDGKPRDAMEPRSLCERLVAALAPALREIARRSGAPDALVLIRDDGAGRCDAVRVAYATLYERIGALPRELQSIFEPLDSKLRQ